VEEQRIIVADSCTDWQKNIKLMLSKAGYLVIGEASDGADHY